ncbi:hypothetical protein CK516_16325 [Nostoc sp. 'Peltigera malacea cyanobiont' DB3992]|nr:hypothetical protein CK516_16325 [Nostoc sp. 'Peltigera malacea cyanobiont' DB3992]
MASLRASPRASVGFPHEGLAWVRGDQQVPKITAKYFSNNLLYQFKKYLQQKPQPQTLFLTRIGFGAEVLICTPSTCELL